MQEEVESNPLKVKRKNLWLRIGNVNRNEVWFQVAEALGFSVTQPKKGSSHFCIREKNSDASDIRGLVTTVASHGKLRPDVNRSIFKNFLKFGVEEDEIWRALGMLKEKEDDAQ